MMQMPNGNDEEEIQVSRLKWWEESFCGQNGFVLGSFLRGKMA